MVKVADLMARVEIDIGDSYLYCPFNDGLYDDMVENPYKYRASKINEKSELRNIGIHFIPEKGRVLRYINNYEIEWVDASSRLHSEFPELFRPGKRAIIEWVEEVSIKASDQVELRIGRYMIETRRSPRRKATSSWKTRM